MNGQDNGHQTERERLLFWRQFRWALLCTVVESVVWIEFEMTL